MQPTYIPWVGYFDLMDQVDHYVLLDDAQFVKQSWQQRNRIKTPKGLEWLTLPVFLSGRFGQRIDEVEIRDPDFWKKHLKTLECNYSRTPFFDRYFTTLRQLFQESGPWLKLVDVNVRLITWLAREVGITTPVTSSSTLGVQGVRSKRLVSICETLGAQTYLSPIGAAEYLLHDLAEFRERGLQVEFHHYQHPVYRQLFGTFASYASVIDLLFNEGPSAAEIMRTGRAKALTPEEVSSVVQQKESSHEPHI